MFVELSLAIVDAYALLVRRSLRNCTMVGLFIVGDAVRIFCMSYFQRHLVELYASSICSLISHVQSRSLLKSHNSHRIGCRV